MMRETWKSVAILGPMGLTLCGGWTARAQEAATSPQVSPSQQGIASAQRPGMSPSAQVLGHPVYASNQSSPGAMRGVSRQSIASLRNPWEWGTPDENRGLMGRVGAQASPQAPGAILNLEPVTPGGPSAPPATAAEAGAPGSAALGESMGAGALPPGTSPTTGAAAAAATAGAAEAFAAAAADTGAGPGFGGGLGAASETLPMIGDRGPLFLRQNLRFPPVPSPFPPGVPRPGNSPGALAGRSVAAIVPAIRGFKIADNQYPRPVDRVWTSFNYYDGVNSGINGELGAPIKNMQVYNETFGFEKTFLDQQASLGFRLPVNTLTITSGFPGLGGTHTALGNFSSFFKYLVYDDPQGNVFSVGLDMSYPTGPRTFAGYPSILGINPFEIQPFFGYILRGDRSYLQGFNSIVVPTDRRLATMYYCDIGVGYFLYRSADRRALLSAIVPSFETHLNIPLNWVGFQPQYIGGTPNIVDLTFGLNVGLSDRAVLSLAYVRPVTGPLPFGGEFAMLLNVPFGGRARQNLPLTPPVIGQ